MMRRHDQLPFPAVSPLVLGALLALLGAGPLAAEVGPGPVQMLYKPYKGPLDYASDETTIRVELPSKGAAITHRYDFKKRLRRTVTAAADGRLNVHVEITALKGSLDGRPLDRLPAGPAVNALMTPRGCTLDSRGRETSTPLALVLPAKPLPAPVVVLGAKSLQGERWTSTAPVSDDLPIPLTTNYRVTGVARISGRECIIIRTTVRGRAPVFAGRVMLDVWGRGQVAFDPAAGVVVDSESELRISRETTKPAPGEPARVHDETTTRIHLVP